MTYSVLKVPLNPNQPTCGLSANLRCRSEMCCTRLAGKTGRKNVAKNRHLGTIAQLSGYIFTTKAHIDNRKKTC